MKYHQLDKPSRKSKKRLGRGIGSGHGKTAGRGTKGQNARTGGGVRPGFEGGQNPLMKRLPKVRGAKSNRKKAVLIHTDQLNRFEPGTKIDKKSLKEAGLLKNTNSRVKLLSRGKLERKVSVSLDSASSEAVRALEKSGGSFSEVK